MSTRAQTILIAEDNEKNLKLFKLILDANGYRTLVARDGEEAVRIAAEQLPDLILMDIQMPKVDGITALEANRADVRTRGIPAIALTSYAMKGDRERMLAAEFIDYISKPIEKDKFIEQVRKTLTDILKVRFGWRPRWRTSHGCGPCRSSVRSAWSTLPHLRRACSCRAR